jgi:nicotinic acid phosphoribosyltransferase
MSENEIYADGSFFKYVHQSGRFVTTMAHAIMCADKDNIERIRKAFPQMVAAHECSSWRTVPDHFDPVYNANLCKKIN